MPFWYKSWITWQSVCLLPLSLLVWLVSTFKRARKSNAPYSVPVIVVGNLTVGGTGKTPMIIWLVQVCQANNIKVGVVSRGYGASKNIDFPFIVTDACSSDECGDEPKLISMQCHVPVVIDPNRDQAVKHILTHFDLDLVISDDGMQHYQMYRDIEILMLDGYRGLGNGLLLPAGPLRESPKRIRDVDFIVAKQKKIDSPFKAELAQLKISPPINYQGEILLHGPVNVYSGIGNFDSFLTSVNECGFDVINKVRFNDHQKIDQALLASNDIPILITQKDAIKLNLSSLPHVYVLNLELEFDLHFERRVVTAIKDKINAKSHHHTGAL